MQGSGMSELVTNGGMDSDTIWSKGTGWTISGGQALAAATATNQFLSQPVSVIKGGVYQVTFDVANFASGNVRVSFDSGDVGTARAANGTFSESITLTAAATVIRFGRSTADFTGRIDNVSLQGLGATVDEQGLSLALQCSRAAFASPEAWARAVMQAYLNGGTGANQVTAVQEAPLALARSILVLGQNVSPAATVRKAITAYVSQLAAA